MSENTTTTTTGTLVLAQPWQGGREIEPSAGIVFDGSWNGLGEYALVWFPKLGAPRVGSTVMPILLSKIKVYAPLKFAADEWVRTAGALAEFAEARPEWSDAIDVLREAVRAL